MTWLVDLSSTDCSNIARSYSQQSSDISDVRQPITATGDEISLANDLTGVGIVSGNDVAFAASRI